VRVITTNDGDHRNILTYKSPAVHASGSKPEFETDVTDADTMRAILRNLGYIELIAFTKHCRNYRFTQAGYATLATLVRVPELDDTFIEVETTVPDSDIDDAIKAVRAFLETLGITADDLTTEQYTDAVRQRRQ